VGTADRNVVKGGMYWWQGVLFSWKGLSNSIMVVLDIIINQCLVNFFSSSTGQAGIFHELDEEILPKMCQ